MEEPGNFKVEIELPTNASVPTNSTVRKNQGATDSTRLLMGGASGRRKFMVPMKIARVQNPVERAIWLSVFYLRCCWVLWILGLLLVHVKVAFVTAPLSWYTVFTPFWIGNAIAASLQVRLLMRIGNCWDKILPSQDYERLVSSVQHDVDQDLLMNAMPEDNVHLVNHAILGVILAIPILFCLMVSEVMLCIHLETGAPTVWSCLSPVMFIELVMVIQFILIKTNTWRAGVIQSMTLLGTVLVVYRFDHTDSIPWPVALLPLYVVNIVFLHLIIKTVFKHCTGRYQLTPRQILCCVLYVLAVGLTSMAEYSLSVPTSNGEQDIVSDLWLPLGTLFFGLFCGSLAVFIVLDIHAEWLIASKGFGEPLPLSRTEDGWAPSGQEKGYELCLGILDKNARALQKRMGVPSIAVPSRTSVVRDFELVVPLDDYDSTAGSGYDSTVFNDLYDSAGDASDHYGSRG